MLRGLSPNLPRAVCALNRNEVSVEAYHYAIMGDLMPVIRTPTGLRTAKVVSNTYRRSHRPQARGTGSVAVVGSSTGLNFP